MLFSHIKKQVSLSKYWVEGEQAHFSEIISLVSKNGRVQFSRQTIFKTLLSKVFVTDILKQFQDYFTPTRKV